MGAVESTIGGLVQRALMPKEVPDWYNGRKLSFPQAPPNSLRLLGHVELEASDLAHARRFLVEALGGGTTGGGGDSEELRVRAGPSEIRVTRATGASGARGWPGHIYLWMDDLKATLERLRVLEGEWGVELVDQVHNIQTEDSVDALEVQDLDGNCYVMNEAAKGFAERLAKLGAPPAAAGGAPNMLALLEVVLVVPPGAAAAAARFCHQYLGAAVSPKDRGWAMHFSPGRALRQTLNFVEEGLDDTAEEGADPAAGHSARGLCVYMPSAFRFRDAFAKCAEQGLVSEPAAGGLEAAEAAGEFRVRRTVDPRDLDQKVLFDMEWVVRLQKHPECLVPQNWVPAENTQPTPEN